MKPVSLPRPASRRGSSRWSAWCLREREALALAVLVKAAVCLPVYGAILGAWERLRNPEDVHAFVRAVR